MKVSTAITYIVLAIAATLGSGCVPQTNEARLSRALSEIHTAFANRHAGLISHYNELRIELQTAETEVAPQIERDLERLYSQIQNDERAYNQVVKTLVAEMSAQ